MHTRSGYVPSAAADGNYVLQKAKKRDGVVRKCFWTGGFTCDRPQVTTFLDKAAKFKTAREAYNAGGQFKALQYFKAIDAWRVR